MQSLNLSNFKFTNQADQIEFNCGIVNPKNSTVNTWNGDDNIIGKKYVAADFGVLVDVAANGLDSNFIFAELIGRASITTDGIKNQGIIKTGQGADKVVGIAKANLSATAITLSQAIAITETADTTVITSAFAAIEFWATVNGIDNSGGEIYTGEGNDHIYGVAEGSIAAIAIAGADVSAIAETFAKAPMSEGLTAFAEAMAISLAQAKIIATGINNTKGIITTGKGSDYITARATSDASTLSDTFAGAFANATPENKALAQTFANAIAKAEDTAIALDNTQGLIRTGNGDDIIEAIARANNTAIAINNTKGLIRTGNGDDTIIANATGSKSYGIFGGFIYMGDGADKLEASSFGGAVNINMGKGEDFVAGFGEAVIDGGAGFDTLSFGAYKIEDFNISLGTANKNQVIFELDGISMTTTRFEQFTFDNGNSTLEYNDLVQVC
jgi:hypothetical protein